MGAVSYIKINEFSTLAMLDLVQFSESLEDKSKRNVEKKGFHYLLNQLTENGAEALDYMPSGKPFLKGRNEHISLSHSHDKMAVILNKNESTGVDIELIRDKVLLVRHKFLSEKELKELSDTDVEKNLVCWAAKETLYKIQGKKGIDFAKDLFVWNFDYNSEGGILRGNILTEDQCKTYALKYHKIEDYVLVYMLNQIN